MRDPKRIDLIMREIGALWKEKVPDWRLAQLIMNWLSWLKYDPFYMEDSEIVKSIEDYLNTF